MEGLLPGSSLGHMDYGSRNNDFSLVPGICIVVVVCQWFSCLAQFHLGGWTNFSPFFNDWDEAGPPPTSTSRLWIIWDIYVGFAMTSRSSTELVDFSSERVVPDQFPGCLLGCHALPQGSAASPHRCGFVEALEIQHCTSQGNYR